MRRFWFALLIVTVSVTATPAQNALTSDQRVADLNQLTSMYAKYYAPYEWKRDTLGFDLLNLNPWRRDIENADDLDFQETLIHYVSALNDAHDIVSFPTTFSASLPLSVDIYDGRVLIDAINRVALPVTQYPFAIGDELVSLDGLPVQEHIQSFRKYAVSANQRSTDRTAAGRIVARSQQIMPHAFELGDTATLVIRAASTDTLNTFTIPWTKIGIALTAQGPVPSPRAQQVGPTTEAAGTASSAIAGKAPTMFRVSGTPAVDNTLPSYMRSIQPLMNADVPQDYYSVLNFGSRFPIYAPPPGFVQRLGAAATDFFLTGTYVANGVRIGLIRVPSMSPPNVALALQQLDQEVAYFNANTDALIIDVTRNPGGLISFVESLAQRFIPTPFRTIGFEIRATALWVNSFASQLTSARLSNAPPQIIQNLQNNFDEVFRAFNENRGRSAPVSLNATGSLTLNPAPTAYAKPLMVLVDEFSASGADMFPAIIQENRRGPIFGTRSMGAGGSVIGFDGTAYSEGFIRITVSLMNRGTVIQTSGFPPAPYIENIGVRADIPQDYMTRANLISGGGPYIGAFTAAIVNLVQSGTSTKH
jgi:hypothetical protein